MPVLLLAQGDPQAKDILRKAIEARYGARPPALDSLQIDFKGKAHTKIGPITAKVPVDVTAYFKFPTAMRWDFTVKPLKLPVQRGVEAYNGEIYRTVRGGKQATVITDEQQIDSMRCRLWAVAAILLTPLSDMVVKLTTTGDYSLKATNTKLNDDAEIFLREDYSLDHVLVNCLNPDTNQQQNYLLRPAEELVNVDDLLLPNKISVFWDDEVSFEVKPSAVQSNPEIPDSVFELKE